MRFVDSAINTELRFSIGQEVESGRYYLSIPVANSLVDYEEHYEISPRLHNEYPANKTQLHAFAIECRARQHDALLFQQPGHDRGIAT